MFVFLAGPRAVSSLNIKVKNRLDNLINNNFTVLVGDANGVDKQIQIYFNSLNYKKVKVFASNGKARNNVGGWEVVNVKTPPGAKGFEFYAAKDLEMAKATDYGFMIWNGKSKGTLNNIYNLIKFNKKVLVYLIPDKQFYTISNSGDIEHLLYKDQIIKEGDSSYSTNDIEQITLF